MNLPAESGNAKPAWQGQAQSTARKERIDLRAIERSAAARAIPNVTLGAKFGLLSEEDNEPLTLSIRNDAIIPTRYALTRLLGNGTQAGAFADLIMVAASRNFFQPDYAPGQFRLYVHTRSARGWIEGYDSGHVGSGFILFPAKRIQFMSEYSGLVFVGAATPNMAFGARDPVDGIWGLRIYFPEGRSGHRLSPYVEPQQRH